MKTTLLLLASLSLMVGCAHTQAPKPAQNPQPASEETRQCDENSCPVPQSKPKPAKEVSVRPIEDLPRVQGEMTGIIEESDNPYEEMEKDNRLMEAIKEAVKHDSCMCRPGDPLCSCL